jgi:hypothetical protein
MKAAYGSAAAEECRRRVRWQPRDARESGRVECGRAAADSRLLFAGEAGVRPGHVVPVLERQARREGGWSAGTTRRAGVWASGSGR